MKKKLKKTKYKQDVNKYIDIEAEEEKDEKEQYSKQRENESSPPFEESDLENSINEWMERDTNKYNKKEEIISHALKEIKKNRIQNKGKKKLKKEAPDDLSEANS